MKRIFKILGLLALCGVLSACQEDLLKGLDQDQANEVLATLQRYGVNAKKIDGGKEGYAVDVDKADFPAAVDLLKTYDLPSRKRVEISDFFPNSELVSSPLAERARLYSAIEQRLEQSLLTFDNIAVARVHISYPLDDKDAQQPVHVSVLISTVREVDSQVFISEVKRFLKNSLDGVDYDDISVVLTKADPTRYTSGTTIQTSSAAVDANGSTWWEIAAAIAVCLLVIGLLVGVFKSVRARVTQKA